MAEPDFSRIETVRDRGVESQMQRCLGVLAGVAEGHKWVNPDDGSICGVVIMREGEGLVFELEDILIHEEAFRRGIRPVYAGRLSMEETLGEMMLRKAYLTKRNFYDKQRVAQERSRRYAAFEKVDVSPRFL